MNSIGIQLRISDLLFAVQKRWKIIASLTFLGFVFGLMLSGMNYVQSAVQSYQIEGSFVINAVNSQGRYSGGSTAPNRTENASVPATRKNGSGVLPFERTDQRSGTAPSGANTASTSP